MAKPPKLEYIPTKQYGSGMFHLGTTYDPPPTNTSDPIVKIKDTIWLLKEITVSDIFIYGDTERSYDAVMVVVDNKIVAPIRSDALFDLMFHGTQQNIQYEQRFAYPVKRVNGAFNDTPIPVWGYSIPQVKMTYRLRGSIWTVWPKK